MIRYNPQKITLDYGRIGLDLELDNSIADWVVIEPEETLPSAGFDQLFLRSAEDPIESLPLSQIISPDDNVVIVTSDGTRPVPNKLLIPAIIDLCRLTPDKVTILIGSGSHRPHTKDELIEILGEEICNACTVICHDARDLGSLKFLGYTPGGIPVSLNKRYLDADKRIVLGFIEPHFFAGFSGGPKGICPAVAGLDTIDAFHSFQIIGHPNSDYGILDGNPQYQASLDAVSLAPPDFLINVLLNNRKEIISIYSGNYIEAHKAGAREAATLSIVPVNQKFPIVVTTNSGYPLDQNLYQTVKGIWTAARIVEEGGSIIVVSECSMGIPDDGNFASLMSSRSTLDDLLQMLGDAANHTADRWQAQKLSIALKKATIYIYSSLDRRQVERCKMIKSDNISRTLSDLILKIGKKPSIAILPRGPMTVPA